MHRYRLLGVNQDQDTCSHCGKQNLKKVVWLQAIDQDGSEVGGPEPVGANCAARMLRYVHGRTADTVLRRAEEIDYQRQRQELLRVHEVGPERSVNTLVVEAIGAEGSLSLLGYANGLKSAVEMWARDRWPNLITHVRWAR